MMLKSFLIKLVLISLLELTLGEAKDDVILTAPVLAPPSQSRGRSSETAKDFPVLTLLATDYNDTVVEEPKGDEEPRPVYVKKLEDLPKPERRRRRHHKILLVKENK